jgi:hypothetical protein
MPNFNATKKPDGINRPALELPLLQPGAGAGVTGAVVARNPATTLAATLLQRNGDQFTIGLSNVEGLIPIVKSHRAGHRSQAIRDDDRRIGRIIEAQDRSRSGEEWPLGRSFKHEIP